MDINNVSNDMDSAIELTELFVQPQKSYNLADIITFQAIISVVVSVVFIIINTFYPSVAAEIYDEAVLVYQSTSETSDLVERVTDFLNSSPSDYLDNDKV